MARRSFAQFLEDMRWAMNAQRARRMRREMGFSERIEFDNELRPILRDGIRISYPDALYHIKIGDVLRAFTKVQR